VHLIPLYKTNQVMALGHNVSVGEERMVELKEKIAAEVTL
jgi:hypothetical protein